MIFDKGMNRNIPCCLSTLVLNSDGGGKSELSSENEGKEGSLVEKLHFLGLTEVNVSANEAKVDVNADEATESADESPTQNSRVFIQFGCTLPCIQHNHKSVLSSASFAACEVIILGRRGADNECTDVHNATDNIIHVSRRHSLICGTKVSTYETAKSFSRIPEIVKSECLTVCEVEARTYCDVPV